MTKTVRVENADTNTSKIVIVESWERNPESGEWRITGSEKLGHPTHLANFTLWEGKELRIREE
jgi:hypothetical protein